MSIPVGHAFLWLKVSMARTAQIKSIKLLLVVIRQESSRPAVSLLHVNLLTVERQFHWPVTQRKDKLGQCAPFLELARPDGMSIRI